MMEQNLIEMSAPILGMSEQDVRAHCKLVPEIDGYYAWNPIRGGRAILVAKNGSCLVATSSVSFERHLADFLAGRRN